MIDKGLERRPRDILVSKRPDGKRPGYGRWDDPGMSPGTSPSGGGRGGPPGGGDPGMTYSAPAPTADRHPDPSPVTTAKAPPSILARPTPKDTRGDTPERLKEQIILDEMRKKEKEQFEEDWGFEDLKRKAPTTFKPRYVEVTKGVPHLEDPIKQIQPHYYGGIGSQLQPTGFGPKGDKTWRESAEKMIPRGGIMSAIGGGLKKIGKTIFGDNPFDIAMNILTFSGWKQAKYAKMLLNARKEGSISNKAWKKAKYIGNKLLDKKAAKKLVKDKDGIATQIAKGTGLESGAELLGLKDIEGQQAKLTKLAIRCTCFLPLEDHQYVRHRQLLR